MNEILNIPKIVTIFDSPNEFYIESIKKTLAKSLPVNTIREDLTDIQKKEKFIDKFHSKLPLVSWSEIKKAPCNLSFYLCCLYRPNAFRFFYEMLSRWLVPGKRLNALLQFAVDFLIPELSNQIYIGGEVILRVESQEDLIAIKKNLSIMETEIRLGLESFYQASRILEIKGLTNDEKTALIQENITGLIKHRPQDFDYDIFSQMQHFLVICKDQFKAIREYRHMSRIICVHYLFRKALKHSAEAFPERRFLSVKIIRAQLHDLNQKKEILGIIIGLSFLKENELFEEKHIMSALCLLIPKVKAISQSFFIDASRSDPTQLFYLEIEKENGAKFSLNETKLLKEFLPLELKKRIEKRLNPIFMPQNEEEIMRGILTLSNELKFLRDIPQVIISFEKQTEDEVEFIVIMLRIAKTFEELLEKKFKNSSILFIFDRKKTVGFLRKKYRKEATVFRARFKKEEFIRQDHSLDLNKARQKVALELATVIGEFRDYNGGMISKEAEIFSALRKQLGKISKDQEFLLENYFYAFTPVIMRSVLDLDALITLFTMINDLNATFNKSNPYLFQLKKEKEHLFIIISSDDDSFKDCILDSIDRLELNPFQFASSFVNIHDISCLGIICRPSDFEQQLIFIQAIENALVNWSQSKMLNL